MNKKEAAAQRLRVRLWIAYILQALLGLMFIMGAVMNLMESETAVSQAVEMGYPAGAIRNMGIVLLVCTLLYLIPRTNVLGAILLTAWLGGAVATHVIHGDPMVNILFPVFFGLVIWGLMLLRDPGMARWLPWRR